MSSRVLTPDVVGIDALVHDHQTVLAKAEGGVVAVFANNAPAFYAVTPARLAELLALEEKLAQLEFRRMFSGEYDSADCYLDIQAGSGGTEAQDWASMLERMYLPWGNSPCIRTGNPMPTLSAWRRYGAWH